METSSSIQCSFCSYSRSMIQLEYAQLGIINYMNETCECSLKTGYHFDPKYGNVPCSDDGCNCMFTKNELGTM